MTLIWLYLSLATGRITIQHTEVPTKAACEAKAKEIRKGIRAGNMWHYCIKGKVYETRTPLYHTEDQGYVQIP